MISMITPDHDAFHILPLSIIPLKTEALRRARLVKNARLEGVIEMFAGDETGSGQVTPEDLPQVFAFGPGNKGDLKVVEALSELPAYDVYSLRPQLARLGIELGTGAELRLSEESRRRLGPYMRPYLQPLVIALFGPEHEPDEAYSDISSVFRGSDAETVRSNIEKLASVLGMNKKDIPGFLEIYADVYLALAYYQFSLDENLPKLDELLRILADIKTNEGLSTSSLLANSCTHVEQKLQDVARGVSDALAAFRGRTGAMWQDMSEARFHEMEDLVSGHYTAIGGSLCAFIVKMNAWSEKFPNPSGGLLRRAEFVMSDMRQGLDRIEPVRVAA